MNELKRLRKENQKLKEKMEQLTQEHSEKEEDLTNTITAFLANTITELKLKQNEFSLEIFKDNSKLFMFYTGCQSYDLLKIFFEFLGPAVNKINCCGSNTRNDDSFTPESSKRGPKRQMNPEQELFIVLARLRCDVLEQDLAVRCKLSTSHLSGYSLQGNSMVVMIFFEKKSCQEFSEAAGNNSELKY